MLGQKLTTRAVVRMDAAIGANDLGEQREVGDKKTSMHYVKGRINTFDGKDFVYLPYRKFRINFVET